MDIFAINRKIPFLLTNLQSKNTLVRLFGNDGILFFLLKDYYYVNNNN